MIVFHLSDDECRNALSLYRQADVLVTTGDLRSYCLSWLRRIPEAERIPALGVYGNHDVSGYMNTYAIQDLHDRVMHFGGMSWGGFQGCPRYREGPLMFSEQEAAQWAGRFPPIDVLLLHAGPQGMLDDPSDDVHRGSAAVRSYVLERRPQIVFVGHQYSNATMQVNGTTLFRTYGGRLIEI